MLQRLKLFLIAFGLLFAGMLLAQEPPGQPDDPPVRLKKKNPGPAKPDPVKPPMPEEKQEPSKKEDAKDDPEPPAPQEEDAEVLARVAKNVRLAEEKIANQELNDGTRQLQEDILKDLDSLIRSAENPQGGGGGGGGDDKDQDQSNSSDKSKSSSKSQSGPGSMGKQSGGKQQGGSSRAMRRKQGNGSQQANKGGKQNGSDPRGKGQPNDQANQQANNKDGGNNGGGGGKTTQGPPDKNADLYKDVWGHLPEALRAEMNAYSNDKQFMMKYDELIKRYYRTIAEQGRRKGD